MCALDPRLLTENEKERRVVASREFLLKNQRDPTFLDRIITVDETWLHYYDPEEPALNSEGFLMQYKGCPSNYLLQLFRTL